ncbi:Rho GTPase activation protein [Peniophora sp. CONT]|nr:Rho GTPase activation protein [Peniophora sp. CONT]
MARPLSLASFKQLNFNSHQSQSKNKAHPHAAPSPLRAMTADIRAQPQQEHNQQNSKALRTWWQHFTTSQKLSKPGPLPDKDDGPHPVFGKPLKDSLKYASVQISTAGKGGELYVWGYIPVVVAKCGLFLKENATEVEGTFRVNGSNKRMRELQAIFETPPKYGKSLDWKKENYTTHDVASVFRRYLTQMPEPVIPYDMYHNFRDAIAKKPYNQDEVIATYKRLIGAMPRANQYLLLYVLDLLSVFARKHEKNLMTAANLAVIFRPGIMSHPTHELSPHEHQLSQEVLEFLIAHQDWFMLDIPAAPEDDPSLDRVDSPSGWSVIDAASPSESSTSVLGTTKMQRRRTTTDRERTPMSDKRTNSPNAALPVLTEDLAPSPTGSSRSHPSSPASGVSRSRTLPSQRSAPAGFLRKREGNTNRRSVQPGAVALGKSAS